MLCNDYMVFKTKASILQTKVNVMKSGYKHCTLCRFFKVFGIRVQIYTQNTSL